MSFICPFCNAPFIPKHTGQIYCSKSHAGRASAERRASEDWGVYFKRLVARPDRKSLSYKDCLKLLREQNGKCALSGVELTHSIERGTKCLTNASLDRIEAGGPYIKDNIQLVCSALNFWRSDTELKEFIWWCKKVAEFNS